MINKFYENEKNSLERLGANRKSKEDNFNTEQQRLTVAQSLYQAMEPPKTQSALYFKSHVQFRDNIRSVIETQRRDLDMAKLDLDNAHVDMMRQFGKVKGLEKVIKKRNAFEQSKAQRREQASNDDMSARSFIQDNLARNLP